MKNLYKFTLLAFACSAVVAFSSCSEDEGVESTIEHFTPDGSVAAATVLEDYAQDIVIDRYVTLADASKTLYEAVSAITLDGSTLEAAGMSTSCDAWKAARVAWERTEAYLFGPVDAYGIDPGIDSWPLALADLAESIIDYSAGEYTDSDIQKDGGDLKGFHAIEFMLFNDGASKTKIDEWDSTYGASYGFGDGSPTSAELKTYLVAISKELYRCTTLLVAEWDNTNSNLANYSAVYSAGDETDGSYYTTFTTAGSGNSEYPNQSIALSTIVEAAAGIADEVGSVKIADPIKSGNVLDVESWFSHNSVTDFTNNIIGIKEAYYGKQYSDSANSSSTTSGSAASASISAYVASGNSALDADVKDAIDTAIDAVAAMPAPFRDNLEWDAENTAAAEACAALLEALETAQGAINDGYYTK